ncbi:MAG: hypothetical protein WD598_15530 [Acidimicrobiia bacterium]
MPITQVDINDAEKLLDELLGNQQAAADYSRAPEQWLQEHGYANVNPEAVAQCGANYAGGAAGGVASASASASASAGVAGVAAQLNPIVYNTYIEDNSITNNLQAEGNIDFDQDVQQVHGDGNVLAGDDISGDVQTGDGVQTGGGDITDSNVATGDDNQQAIDESENIDVDVDLGRPPLLRAEVANGPEEADPDFN